MKATYDPTAKTKFTSAHRKEGKCFFNSMQIVSLAAKPWSLDRRMDAVIECRLYGTGNQNTCCLWIRGIPVKLTKSEYSSTQGSGKAGGYGYHRPSAALAEAICNAGFTLDKDIAGVGDSAMREALLAIAKCIGVKRPALIESHP